MLLTPLFKLKPNVELFREKRLPTEEPFKNKLGYIVRTRVAVLSGTEMASTADLAVLLAAPLSKEIEALGYSDFILRWQNFFADLPYCVQLSSFRKDLRGDDDTIEDPDRVAKLDAVLHPQVAHAVLERDGQAFIVQRTLGIAAKEKGMLTCAIWTTRERIEPDGKYTLELVEKLFEEPVVGNSWTNLPRWFPRR